jgi:hypothetical protein
LVEQLVVGCQPMYSPKLDVSISTIIHVVELTIL